MTLKVLVVDDEYRFRELYCRVLSEQGFSPLAAESVEAALAQIDENEPDMVISDVRMPGADGLELLRTVRSSSDVPFLLVTAYADVQDAVTALKLGAVDYLAKPVDLDELIAAVRDHLGQDLDTPDWEVPNDALEGIVAESPALRVLFRDAWRVAASDATILLGGESGVGKEVLAQFIHGASERAGGPLVAVNCGAIARDLLASELFGHVKGAFTGASTQRTGRFREADGGTLFLDEVGELPLELQPTLLRVLETRTLTPVGSDREHAVDFRLIAATNRELEADVETGRFRADLFYRLNVIAFDIPPLRDRNDDIIPLARFFLGRLGYGEKRLSPAASRLLTSHPWPGNARELANAMERASLLSTSEVILPEHLPPSLCQGTEAKVSPKPPSGRDIETLEQAEIEHIRRALEQTGGNRTRAAKLLGITRRGLIYKIKRFEL